MTLPLKITTKDIRKKWANEITGVDFMNLKRPIVYVWMRGSEYLYVGIGRCGIGRIFASHPHIRSEMIQDNDTISWQFFHSPEEASREECRLIRLHQPKYNIAHTFRNRIRIEKKYNVRV